MKNWPNVPSNEHFPKASGPVLVIKYFRKKI